MNNPRLEFRKTKAVRFNNNDTWAIDGRKKNRTKLNIQEIANIAKRAKTALEKKHKNDNVLMNVTGKAHQWLTLSGFGGDIDVNRWEENIENYQTPFVKYNYDVFYTFRLMYRLVPKNGGDDEHNNCLWRCLQPSLGKHLGGPASFKKWVLKVGRDDKVPFTKLPAVCKKFKVQIRLSGDVTKVYGAEYTTIINIKLENGHYTAITPEQTILPKFQFSDNLPLLSYDLSTGLYTTDGVTTQEFENEEQLSRLKDKYHISPAFKKMDLLESHNQYIKEMNELKEHGIDMYRLRCNIRMAARETLKKHTNKLMIEAENVTNHEGDWIDACDNGGLTWCEKGKHKKVYAYDYVSRYADLLNKPNFKIPMKEGIFQQLDELPDKLEYGMYRCRITSNHKDIQKVFRFSKNHTYTHFSISYARFLMNTHKMIDSIELIHDEEANALVYPEESLVRVRTIFGGYIERLNDLKQKNIGGKTTKLLLSAIWGVLCDRNKKYMTVDVGSDIQEPNWKLHAIQPVSDDKLKLEVRGTLAPFRYRFGRLMPFLVSKARIDLANLALNDIDNVVFIHTDGLGFSRKQKFVIELGDGLGQLRKDKKKTGTLMINHINSIEKL